jgi:hypothetical protein
MASGMLVAGCTVSTSFNPLGNEATMEGAWEIDTGQGVVLPADARSCANARIATVELQVFEDFDVDPDTFYTSETLTFDCRTGSFDTRPDAVLDDGFFTVQYVALDAAGIELDRSEPIDIDVPPESHVALPSVIFEPDDVFYPVGTDVSLSGMWEIDLGSGPQNANATSCEQAGISQVQMRVFAEDPDDPAQPDLERFLPIPDLTFDCFRARFDTREPPPDDPEGTPIGPVLSHGRYFTQWAVLDDTGELIGEGEYLPLDVRMDETDHAELTTAVLTVGTDRFDPRGNDSSLEGEWLLNGAAATEANCQALGIDQVQLVFTDGEGARFSSAELTWPCTDGSFDTRPTTVLRAGSYFVEWVALDAVGGEVEHLREVELEVGTGHTVVPPGDFGVETGVLSVQLKWQRDAEDTEGGSCAEAGVDNLFWSYIDEGGNDVTGASGPCFDNIPMTTLAFGEYEVSITGTSTEDQWEGVCTGLVVDSDTQTYECFIDLAP